MNNCINCGNEGAHRHHVVPKSLGGNEGSNCVWLCEKCHGLIHSVSYNDGTISHSALTKIGLEKARLAGKRVGAQKGDKYTVKKAEEAKELIKKYSKDFDGSFSDVDCIKIIEIARGTYYKYKRELREQLN